MPRFTIVLVTVLAGTGCGHPAPAAAPLPERTALTATLQAQFARSAADWNRGDLDGFVSDYAPDSGTTFIAAGHLRHGFAFIRENYAPRFAAGARRDSLRFEEFEVRPLSPSLALVTARYILFRNGETTASGPFTLVMESRPDGWKILHDHSSSDPR